MSERLAASAALSILMMSIYVLFGNDAARLPIGPADLSAPEVTMPGLPGNPGLVTASVP